MKNRIRKGFAALTAVLLGSFLLAPLMPVRAADTTALDEALEQTIQLQELAEKYAEQQTESDPMMLTINYIRARRYADASWDMILSEPDEGFAQFVEQQAPALEQLQTLENVQIPATGETVDFVHLVAGIGATYKRMPVICTWGGDCIQLAGSIQGTGANEEGCIQQLAAYFACEDENASLLPQSDWLADLDGVNIGSASHQGDALAESIRNYYDSIDSKERARKFVLAQFGEADTGDQQAFRQQVKDKFFGDAGVQLFLLSQEQMTMDDNKNFVVVDSMNAPLNAVCSLTADTLAEMLDGATVKADSTKPQQVQEDPEQMEKPQSGVVPALGQSSLAQTLQKNSWLPWALGGVVLLSLLVLVVLSRSTR